MTVLIAGSIVLLFFLIPYLMGNIYGFIFRKKTMGCISTYLSGMAIMYSLLTIIQLFVVKFKFNFQYTTKIYHVLFILCIILGCISLFARWYKDKAITWEILFTKKNVWIWGLVLLQGVLYIGLKNPYFENNALLETAKVTLETGTIYEFNAFTGKEAVAGFPLSNKLIFLPVFYAYISKVFGVNASVLLNFVVPAVTFISFYLGMFLWVQKLGEETQIKWENLLLMLIWILQIGDGWSHSTSFRILHSGYTGEALFFGVLAAYALYSIKNRSYFIALVCVCTFPGLIKYDAVFDFLKGLNEYRKEGAMYGGMLLVYILALVYYVLRYKKISAHLLNLNLTICLSAMEIRNKVVCKGSTRLRKMINGAVVLLLLLMCGNIMLISNATDWRSNVYGVTQDEYKLLEKLASDNEGSSIKVMATDDLAKWIKRSEFEIEPVVGYDLGGKGVWWYSYEKYDENHQSLWQNVNHATVDMEQELMFLKEEIEMDYVIVKRITEIVPIRENDELKCVYETPSYLVYSVDKK